MTKSTNRILAKITDINVNDDVRRSDLRSRLVYLSDTVNGLIDVTDPY